MTNTYWAAKTGDEFLTELFKRIETSKDAVRSSPYFRLILQKRRVYYGQSGAASAFGMRLTGERGQLVAIHDNKIREVATHVLGLLNTDPFGYTAEPLNSDAKSQNQALLVNDFLRTIVESKELGRLKYESDERALLDAEAFIHIFWDPFAGLLVGQDEETGRAFYEGDIVFEIVGPDRIIRDALAPRDKQQYLGVISTVNKHDLAAQYPQYAEDILSVKSETRPFGNYGFAPPTFMTTQTSDDFIEFYTFYHAKTPALPNGKFCQAVTSKLYLVEGELEYSQIPIIRHAAADVLDSVYGYTSINDALVHNEILNASKSVQLSNALNHGTRTILVKTGNKFTPTAVGGGAKVVEYTTDAPTIMEFPTTPAEVIRLEEQASQDVTNKLGQNAISMGQLEASTRLSYDTVAMAESKGMQSISAMALSSTRAWTQVGHLIVEIFKLKAKAPRIMRMVGESGAYLIEDFSAEKLGDIDRIKITIGNALNATPNQRMNLVQLMLQYGLIDDPTDLAEFVLNGKIDRPLMSKVKKAIRIKEHCELLSRGEIPMVLPTDDHVLFVQHVVNSVLNQESTVRDETVRNAVTMYVEQHVQMAKDTPPQLAAFFGHTPLPIVPPPGEMNAPTDVPPEESGAPTEQPAEAQPAPPVEPPIAA